MGYDDLTHKDIAMFTYYCACDHEYEKTEDDEAMCQEAFNEGAACFEGFDWESFCSHEIPDHDEEHEACEKEKADHEGGECEHHRTLPYDWVSDEGKECLAAHEIEDEETFRDA